MQFPNDRKYGRTHEWAKLEGDLVRVGISEFAAEQLGDIVYVDLPDVGATLTQGGGLGEIESVKAVADLYAPVSGEVVEANTGLLADLDLVSQDPYGDAWIVAIRPTDTTELDSLLDAAEYGRLCEEDAGE